MSQKFDFFYNMVFGLGWVLCCRTQPKPKTHFFGVKFHASQLLFNHATFQGFTSAFNHLYKTKQSYIINKERTVLIESRFTEVWLYYRTLLFYYEVYKSFKNFNFVYLMSLDKNIHSLKKMMLPHYIQKWVGKKA